MGTTLGVHMSLLIVSLLACGNFRRNERPDTPLVVGVDSVSPEYATTLGGQVDILGGPFDDSARVFVDEMEAEVISVERNTIRVSLPELDLGWADVRVEVEDGEGSLDEALRIYQDGTGLAGTMGALEWYELQGNFWTEESQDFGSAWWGMIQPEDMHYWSLFGVQDNKCISNPQFPQLQVIATGADEVVLESEQTSVTLVAADDEIFDATLRSQDYVEWADYAVPSLAGAELPEFGIDRLAATPGAFDLYTPDFSTAKPPSLSQDELVFEWGEVDADRVIIQVERRAKNDIEDIQETVVCVVDNDGSFEIPSDAWDASWQSDEWLYLYVGAVREDGGIIPLNNSESRVAGIYWLLGAASTDL